MVEMAFFPSMAALSAKDVERVLARYRKAAAIQAKVEKTVEQEMLGEKKTSSGDFFFSKGKMRLEITEPEKSTVVYDGAVIWVESRFDEATVEVSKIQSKELKKSDSLLAALFDAKKNALQSFKLQKVKDGSVFSFVPKDKKKTEIQHLELEIQEGDLKRVTYSDSLENSVTLIFSNFKEGSVPKNKFSYKPPKGANVSVF